MGDHDSIDRLHGWLVLLPLLALALPAPYSLYAGAPDAVGLGAGAMTLAAIPGALLAVLRGRGAGAIGLAPMMVLLAVAAVSIPEATDTFGLWRAITGLVGALGWALAGSSLGPDGRVVLQRGLPIAGLMLLASVLTTDGNVGSLGNTGDLMEAVVPCAILGTGVFLNVSGPLAFSGFALLFASAVAMGILPVYAGAASLIAAAAASFGASVLGRSGGENGRRSAARRGRLVLVALLVATLPIGFRALTEGTPQSTPEDGAPAVVATPTIEAATTTGGFRFRQLTWARVPSAVRAFPPTGAGPGQFQAAFPPFRDPAEIELSSFDRREPTPVEVEHAHNDVLTAMVEYGPVGGGAFLLLLVIIALRALRQIAGGEPTRRDFALAAIACIANAMVNAPLLYGPLAPAIAFVIFGVVMAPRRAVAGEEDEDDAPRRLDGPATRYLVPVIPFVLLLLVAPRAWSLVQYGRTLAEVETARIELDDGREGLEAGALRRILDRAAGHAPDSPIVLEKRAQLMRRTGAKEDAQRAVLQRWSTARPHSFAAHLARGNFEAQRGRFEDATIAYERAYAVDEGHHGLLRNRVRAACDVRDVAAVEVALADAVQGGAAPPEWLRTMALEELLEGHNAVAAPLVARAFEGDLAVDTTDPNACYAASQSASRDGDSVAKQAFEVAFQMAMAARHLKDGSPESAAASARQAYQTSRDAGQERGIDSGAIRLRLAAARAAAGETDKAQALLDEAPIRDADRGALSAPERDALTEAGLANAQVAAGGSTEPSAD